MKIAYICSDIDIPVMGHEGCSIHVREFTDALVDAGNDVFILSNSASGNGDVSTKARVYHLEAPGLTGLTAWLINDEPFIQEKQLQWNLRSLLSNSWLQARGSAILEREQPDVLYERYSLFGGVGVDLARQFAIPLLLEVNAPLRIEQEMCETFTLRFTAEFLEAEIFQEANAIITVSRWLKDWICARGIAERKIRVIPNAVSDDLFGPRLSGEDIRTRYDLGGKRVIGFVGSFQPWHDTEALLEVFAKLHRRDPQLRLLFVGDGPLLSQLKGKAVRAGISDAVVFTGSVPHEQVPGLIAAMDVAAVPYQMRQDQVYWSPLKLFEYMAAGKPTLAAALGQVSEIIEHGRTGWLYTPGNVAHLEEGLATLLSTPALACSIGEDGRREVLAKYTWKAVAAKVIRLVQELCDTTNRPSPSAPCSLDLNSAPGGGNRGRPTEG